MISELHTTSSKVLFPLSMTAFYALMDVEQYKLKAQVLTPNTTTLQLTDFKAVFEITIAEMCKNGVVFSSPGASQPRKFIYWFNAHFWGNMAFERNIRIKDSLFSILYEMVIGYYKNTGTNILLTNEEKRALTIMGIDFINTVAGFRK